MNFVLATAPVRYWWPVEVDIPDPENPGRYRRQHLKMLFEAESQDDALNRDEALALLETTRERIEHERNRLLAVCKSWDDVIGDDKTPVPFTEENFLSALQHSWFRTGVYRAYLDSISGRAALGN